MYHEVLPPGPPTYHEVLPPGETLLYLLSAVSVDAAPDAVEEEHLDGRDGPVRRQ